MFYYTAKTMKISVILAIVLTFGYVAQTQAEDCEIPGKTMHWIADYCLHLAETDDFQEQKVQACFEQNQGHKARDACESSKRYKKKLCQHMVSKGYYEGDAEMCFNDREFVPTTVSRGGI